MLRTDDGVDGLGEAALRDIQLARVQQETAKWIGLDPLTLSLAAASPPGAGNAASERTILNCIIPQQTPDLRDRIDYVFDRVEALHRQVP